MMIFKLSTTLSILFFTIIGSLLNPDTQVMDVGFAVTLYGAFKPNWYLGPVILTSIYHLE